MVFEGVGATDMKEGEGESFFFFFWSLSLKRECFIFSIERVFYFHAHLKVC